MTRRRGQIENDLVFDQRDHIELFLCRKKILRVILDFFLRQFFFVRNELQQASNRDHISDRLETTLATHGQGAVNAKKQLRPIARAKLSINAISQYARRIHKEIEHASQADDGQFALQRACLPRKSLTVNNNPLRHKGRMILFLAFEVKALKLSSSPLCDTSFRRKKRSPMRKQLVLASTSPYRRELLSRLGLAFATANPDVDETALPGESPEATALRLSEAKARAVANAYPQALIIGSDQVACLDGEIFGKPGTHEKAVRQLKSMRGRTVNFFTGLCLLNAETGRASLRGVPTWVTFRDLGDAEIESYLRAEKPYACAGSAKAEGLGIALIARMQGDDPNALIGLPLIALCDLLALENYQVL